MRGIAGIRLVVGLAFAAGAGICAAGQHCRLAKPAGPIDLAGTYRNPVGLEQHTLHLTAVGRFGYQATGAEGVYSSNDGVWQVAEGVVILSPVYHEDSRHYGTPLRLVPVRRGATQFLVPEPSMPSFRAWCTGSPEPGEPGLRGGWELFYVRAGGAWDAPDSP